MAILSCAAEILIEVYFLLQKSTLFKGTITPITTKCVL